MWRALLAHDACAGGLTEVAVLAIVVYIDDATLQVVLAMGVCFVGLGLHAWRQPYSHDRATRDAGSTTNVSFRIAVKKVADRAGARCQAAKNWMIAMAKKRQPTPQERATRSLRILEEALKDCDYDAGDAKAAAPDVQQKPKPNNLVGAIKSGRLAQRKDAKAAVTTRSPVILAHISRKSVRRLKASKSQKPPPRIDSTQIALHNEEDAIAVHNVEKWSLMTIAAVFYFAWVMQLRRGCPVARPHPLWCACRYFLTEGADLGPVMSAVLVVAVMAVNAMYPCVQACRAAPVLAEHGLQIIHRVRHHVLLFVRFLAAVHSPLGAVRSPCCPPQLDFELDGCSCSCRRCRACCKGRTSAHAQRHPHPTQPVTSSTPESSKSSTRQAAPVRTRSDVVTV